MNSTVMCEEFKITSNKVAEDGYLNWTSNDDTQFSRLIFEGVAGLTTWMGNYSSIQPEVSGCGPRYAQLLVLQAASDYSAQYADALQLPYIAQGRLWACNNTLGYVEGHNKGDYAYPYTVELAQLRARFLAGAIGWSAVEWGNS